LPVFVLVSYANPVPQESCGSALGGPKNWWLYRLKVRAYGITSCAPPLLGGESRSRWLNTRLWTQLKNPVILNMIFKPRRWY